MYNAEGELFKPFIAHKGNIPDRVQKHFKEDMIFCQTFDGHLSQSVLIEVFKCIQRYYSFKMPKLFSNQQMIHICRNYFPISK